MLGTALAAASRSTVMRTISDPARASVADWRAVAAMSAVSVLVIDCTTIGASPPMTTPPTATGTQMRRDLRELVIVAIVRPLPHSMLARRHDAGAAYRRPRMAAGKMAARKMNASTRTME